MDNSLYVSPTLQWFTSLKRVFIQIRFKKSSLSQRMSIFQIDSSAMNLGIMTLPYSWILSKGYFSSRILDTLSFSVQNTLGAQHCYQYLKQFHFYGCAKSEKHLAVLPTGTHVPTRAQLDYCTFMNITFIRVTILLIFFLLRCTIVGLQLVRDAYGLGRKLSASVI